MTVTIAEEDAAKPRSPPRPLTLLQLKDHSCRWPVSEEAPFEFCGADKVQGHSYCVPHLKLAYTKGYAA